MNIAAIIQARMGSIRLPKKVLMKINGITVLESLVNQLSFSKYLNQKIIATTTDKSDDILIDFIKSLNMMYFRGNQFDVLDRYYQCAKYYSIKNIVRISGDAPLIDPEIVDKTIELYLRSNLDYVNNFNKNRFPIGTEVEVFSFATLETTWKNAKKYSEREHVTPYIYNNPRLFSIGHLENNTDLSNLHWTVDRVEDLEFVRIIHSKISKKPVLLQDILDLLKKEPAILEINKNVNPHEGYEKSLQEDNLYLKDMGK